MAKKQSDGEAAEAAGKRRPQKKPAAAKPGARARPAKGGKPSKPAKPPSKPSRSGRSGTTGRIPRPTRAAPVPSAQAELPIDDGDAIDDADIVSETRIEAVVQAVADLGDEGPDDV